MFECLKYADGTECAGGTQRRLIELKSLDGYYGVACIQAFFWILLARNSIALFECLNI